MLSECWQSVVDLLFNRKGTGFNNQACGFLKPPCWGNVVSVLAWGCGVCRVSSSRVFFSLPRSFSRSLSHAPLECLLSPLLRVQWDSCLMEFISDMCSQLDAGSRSTNPLTNVPHIFRMMFQHVLLIAPHPHPLLFFSCVYVCFYRQEVTSSQLSFLSLPLAAPLISSPSSCSQTHCG